MVGWWDGELGMLWEYPMWSVDNGFIVEVCEQQLVYLQIECSVGRFEQADKSWASGFKVIFGLRFVESQLTGFGLIFSGFVHSIRDERNMLFCPSDIICKYFWASGSDFHD